MVGIAKENTITARLLRLLHGLGFSTADFELHFPVFKGRDRKPDGAFEFGGRTYILSAKFGADKEEEAKTSAENYQSLIGETTRLGEVFAVVYPKGKKEKYLLWLIADSQHPEHGWELESLEAVAGKIDQLVRGKLQDALKEAEPVERYAIRMLSRAVDEIAGAYASVSDERLKGVFGGRDFFDSVLAYELEEQERKDALHVAAGYLLVNQTLFYELLAHSMPEVYTSISLADATEPRLLRERYFVRVLLDHDYRPIFEVDVCSCLEGEAGSNGALKVVNSVKRLIPKLLERREIIGHVFHELIPLAFRKKLAAYFTSPLGADLLVALAVDKFDVKVLDPACGSGTLLVSCYRRKKTLYDGPLDVDLHRKFVEQDLTGIDVMAFVAHLAAVHLALQEPLKQTDIVRVGVEDSTTKSPGGFVSSATNIIKEGFRQRKLSPESSDGLAPLQADAYARAGAVSLDSARPAPPFELSQVDLVIMNPPFTSCNNMTQSYRRAVEGALSDYPRYAKCLKGRWSFQIPFLLIADRFLKRGARLAAVLPMTTFSGKYFEPLVNFLLANYKIRYIVGGINGCAFSDDTQLTEILLVADKESPTITNLSGRTDNHHEFTLVGLTRGPHNWSTDDVRRIANMTDELRRGLLPPPNDLFVVKSIDQDELGYGKATLSNLMAKLPHGFSVTARKLQTVLEGCPSVAPVSQVLARYGWKIYIGKAFRVFKDAPEETGHGLRAYGGEAILFSSNRERARKSQDRMIVLRHKARVVEVEDIQVPGSRFIVPSKETIGYIRRFAGLNRLKADELVDVTIRRYGPFIDPLLNHVYRTEAQTKARILRRDWEKKVEADQSRLLIFYKGDLVTEGTQLISCRAENPVFVAGDVYGIRGTSEEDEKIICLWLNATPFLLSLMADRTVTRGSYGRLDKKTLNRLPLLDPRKLSSGKRKRLVSLFDRLEGLEWPAISSQFKNHFLPRHELDLALMEALGMAAGDADALINLMHETALQKLEGLQIATHGHLS
jgi:hypothetical protein